MKWLYLFSGLILFGCSANSSQKTSKTSSTNKVQNNSTKVDLSSDSSTVVTSISSFLTDVQSVNKSIRIDLKYSTKDNFMKIKLYDRITRAYLQNDVAIRLGKCQTYLTSIFPSLHLLIYDAVRPLSVQRKMWNALDTIPVKERIKFVSNPANRSLHNYGAAIDLTICDEKGIPLDMGAGFDDIREIAYPSLEKSFLNKGLLTKQHIDNRILLRKVMKFQDFSGISTEWWHFDACSRKFASRKYKLLVEEPR